jgi:hypothetical protein
MTDVAELMGADRESARSEFEQVIELEIRLANVSVS